FGKQNGFAASLLDFLQSRRAKAMSGNLQLLRELAVAQYFDHVARPLTKASRLERFNVDFLAGLKCSLQFAQINNEHSRTPLVIETALRDPADQRHPRPFENARRGPASQLALSLMPTAGGFPLAGAGAATDAHSLFVFMDAAMDIVQIHASGTPRSRCT